MIFTVAHIRVLSDVRFDVAEGELLLEYSPPHPGNQRRILQIRFGREAAHELIRAIRALDSAPLGKTAQPAHALVDASKSVSISSPGVQSNVSPRSISAAYCAPRALEIDDVDHFPDW